MRQPSLSQLNRAIASQAGWTVDEKDRLRQGEREPSENKNRVRKQTEPLNLNWWEFYREEV